jgi:hypothetical protein
VLVESQFLIELTEVVEIQLKHSPQYRFFLERDRARCTSLAAFST